MSNTRVVIKTRAELNERLDLTLRQLRAGGIEAGRIDFDALFPMEWYDRILVYQAIQSSIRKVWPETKKV